LGGAGRVYYLGHVKLKEELAPTEDRGFLMGIMLASEGSTIGSSEDSLHRLEAIYDKVPEKNRYFVVMGYPVVSQGISFLRVVDWEERTRKTPEIVAGLGPQMFGGISCALAFSLGAHTLGGG